MKYLLASLCILNLGFMVWCVLLPETGSIVSSFVLDLDADEAINTNTLIKSNLSGDRFASSVRNETHTKIGILELQVDVARQVYKNSSQLSRFKSLAFPMFLLNAVAAGLAVLMLTQFKSSFNVDREAGRPKTSQCNRIDIQPDADSSAVR